MGSHEMTDAITNCMGVAICLALWAIAACAWLGVYRLYRKVVKHE